MERDRDAEREGERKKEREGGRKIGILGHKYIETWGYNNKAQAVCLSFIFRWR